MRTVAFCEIEPYCQTVLRKHWPDVPIFGDIREVRFDRIDADLICGGFPCQDISIAGKGAGIEGERSGLWKEFADAIGEVRPRYVIVENVAALLGRGLERVLGDLAALRYDAEWHCIPASYIGAPHRRDRVWIVAYSDNWRRGPNPSRRNVADRTDTGRSEADGMPRTIRQASAARDVAHANGGNEHGRLGALQVGWGAFAREVASDGELGRTQWGIEPAVGRVAYGIPNRVDRLCGLGNSIVPQIAEIIGRAIMLHEQERQ